MPTLVSCILGHQTTRIRCKSSLVVKFIQRSNLSRNRRINDAKRGDTAVIHHSHAKLRPEDVSDANARVSSTELHDMRVFIRRMQQKYGGVELWPAKDHVQQARSSGSPKGSGYITGLCTSSYGSVHDAPECLNSDSLRRQHATTCTDCRQPCPPTTMSTEFITTPAQAMISQQLKCDCGRACEVLEAEVSSMRLQLAALQEENIALRKGRLDDCNVGSNLFASWICREEEV